jgi:RNase adapter protein RapZ
MSELVVIAGMSGAGRSTAADALEDLGWFVVDNLPPALIPKVADLAKHPGGQTPRVALVTGTGAFFEELGPALRELRTSDVNVRILYLEAGNDILIQRYEQTRRRHPLQEGGVGEAVERERTLLVPVRGEADVIVDTTDMNVHELRNRIVELFARDDPAQMMRTAVMSFGYKHGIPRDVDVVLDCRFLPNPHWEPDLRPLTGLDDPVSEYVLAQRDTDQFIERLDSLLELLLPAYVREGKSYLTLAIGCTGGRHRSVVLAEQIATRMRKKGYEPQVSHRDITK